MCVSFGVPLDVIEIDYGTGRGLVDCNIKHEKLSVEKRTIIALAGLAAERFFQEDPGVVYHTRRINKNFYKTYGPKEFKGMDCEDGDCDLDYVHRIMPSRVRKEKWCNDHLKAAWDILHQNEEAFLQLADALRPCSRHRFGTQTSFASSWTPYGRYIHNEWEFRPAALQRILRKVKVVRARKTAA